MLQTGLGIDEKTPQYATDGAPSQPPSVAGSDDAKVAVKATKGIGTKTQAKARGAARVPIRAQIARSSIVGWAISVIR